MKKIQLLTFLTFLSSFSLFSQFSVEFQPNVSPVKACNNFQYNPIGYWKPTHGTPYGNNSNRVELKAKDAGNPDFFIKSEGVFIDLTQNGLNLQVGNNYKATFYYQNPNSASDVTFRSYLVKSGIYEMSNSDCTEAAALNVSNKKGLYTSNDYLEGTYSGEIKEITIDFTVDSNSYEYLWIYSDYLSQYMNNRTGVIYLTRVRIDYDGTSGCSLNAPSNRNTTNITENSAKLNWQAVSGNSGYQYQYKKSSSSSWTTGITSSTNKTITSLQANTSYNWRVKTKCSNGAYGSWSGTKTFTTLSGCTDNLSITQDVNSGQTDNQQAKIMITATNKINNNATANYDAGTTVLLKPGFHAKAGSTFKVFIEGCNASRSSAARKKEETITVQKDFEVPKELLQNEEFIVKIYPNPTSGFVTITSSKKMVQYSLSNSFSKQILTKKVNGKKLNFNIQNRPKGIYILKIILENGKIMTKKIMKN